MRFEDEKLGLRRRGLTVIEIVVAIFLVGLLVAILVPAIQHARGTARRTLCVSNLRQIGAALHQFDGVHGTLPPMAEEGFSCQRLLLPFLDHVALDRAISDDSHHVELPRIVVLTCPEDRVHEGASFINYAMNIGTGWVDNGFDGLFRDSQETGRNAGGISLGEVRDGLSQTAAFSEMLVSEVRSGQREDFLGMQSRRTVWQVIPSDTTQAGYQDFVERCGSEPRMSQSRPTPLRGRRWLYHSLPANTYMHRLPPNSNSCTNGGAYLPGVYSAASNHAEGVNLLFADGHVEFIANNVARDVWQEFGTPGT